ncbi:hypothetical protein [Cryptosporangium sp. NPDC051539]|uniref:hypothetical protein n=1 Tax=Cryptosporangium sp. NPDC051539 TaxID=3363962 RepID=UPI0037963548
MTNPAADELPAVDDLAVYVDDPSVSDDPAQEAPASDNSLRAEDGEQDFDFTEEQT